MSEASTQEVAAVQLEFPEPLKPRSKYTFEDTPTGFTLHREGGISLPVEYRDTSMWINDGIADAHCGLYGDDLLNAISDRLIDLTMGRSRRASKSDRRDAQEMFHRALGRRINDAMTRVRTDIAPANVVELARKMWASNHTDAKVCHLDKLYTDEYKHLRGDLLKYHACRLYAKFAETAPQSDYLALVADWRTFLGQGSGGNRAINKTLDHFPVGVSFHQIAYLAQFNITTAVTKRLHMVACLCAAEHHHWELHQRAVLQADDEQVLCAAEVQSTILNRRSTTESIRGVMSHILDYEEPYHGDLVGLSRRSLHWHDNLHRERYKRPQRAENEPTARPAIDLDGLAEQGITFLDTANAVIAEGDLMDHCVASYADKAVAGQCYLFHVEYEGHMATIEATPSGKVIQAYGPRDTNNPACGYGTGHVERAFEKLAEAKS